MSVGDFGRGPALNTYGRFPLAAKLCAFILSAMVVAGILTAPSHTRCDEFSGGFRDDCIRNEERIDSLTNECRTTAGIRSCPPAIQTALNRAEAEYERLKISARSTRK